MSSVTLQGQRNTMSTSKMRLGAVILGLLLSAGCGVRHGAGEGTPGHVSRTNEDCASLFCSAEDAETDERCAPSCMCGGYVFSEPRYDEQDLHALRSWRLLNPAEALMSNPFEQAVEEPEESDAYCAAIPVDQSPAARTYRLETFASENAVRAAGGQVTHQGRCGACSSFQDLAAYIERRDLNRAGRLCGLSGTLGSKTQLRCLKKLGFTDACAQIWSLNIDNTRSKCMGTCAATIPTRHKLPNGNLNACLACDEVSSGPTFKAVAGRTRRRSGLSSAIARPCLDAAGRPAVYPVEHYYFASKRK